MVRILVSQQVAGDVPLETLPEGSVISGIHPSDIANIDDNVDYTNMSGLTKEQVDKSCTSGIQTSTSKAPSTVHSLAKLAVSSVLLKKRLTSYI